jgi:hypothetical protein
VGMAKPLPEQAFLLRCTPAQGARFRSHVRGDARHILMLPSRHTEGNPPRPLPSREGRCARIRVLAATPSPVIPAEAGISPDIRGVRHPRCRLSLA